MNTKKIISALLAAAMLSVTAYAADFGDVPDNHWAGEYIDDMAYKGIIDGYDDNTFMPEKQVTRAEFAAMLCRATGVWSREKTAYSDVSQSDWYYGYVTDAAKCFDTADSFRPNEPITRLDAAKAIVRALGAYEADAAQLAELDEKFSDISALDADSKNLLAQAVSSGAIDGFDDNTFRPSDTLSRAQAAAIISRSADTDIVIEVGDRKIFSRELTSLCTDYYGGASPEMKNAFANGLITIFGGAQVAKEEGIAFSDETISEIEDYVLAAMEQNDYISNPELLIEFNTANTYCNELYNEYLRLVNISDEDADKLYKENYYRAKHILIDDEKKAKELLKKAESGEDFDALIKDNSTDPGSLQYTDGYIFTDGEMVKPFEECVKSLEPGKFGLCQSEYGWHIIQRLELTDNAAGYGNIKDAVKSVAAEQAVLSIMTEKINALNPTADWDLINSAG